MFVSLTGELPDVLEICTEGEIAGYDTRILELAVLKGFFGAISDEPVTYVNAPQLAKEHGVEVRDVNCADVGQLRQPADDQRRRPLDQRHAGRAPAASSASSTSTTRRSTCRPPTTWSWSRTTTAPA